MERCRQDKVLLLDIDQQFSRHSEGSFIRLKDGGILFVWSRFEGDWHDDAPSNLAGILSHDEGKSWGEPRLLVNASDFGIQNVMSPSFLRMADGSIGLFYIRKQSPFSNEIWLARSSDEGQSFPSHSRCTLHHGEGLYILNNHRVQRLSSGRILLPLAYHRTTKLSDGRRAFDSRAVAVFLASDDDGHSFHECRQTVSLPLPQSDSGLQEPGVIELSPGLLWAYARTDMMYQYEFFSFDQGESWTQAQPSRFTSPLSPMLIDRQPETGHLFAFFNPMPNYFGRNAPRATGGRTPLVLSISRDNGRSFEPPLIIEDDPARGYCYPASFFTKDGKLLLSYCSGTERHGFCLAQTTISRIDLGGLPG